MREIQAQQITDVVERLCIEANEQLPGDIKDAIRRCRACEDWEIAQGVLDKIITRIPEWPASSWKSARTYISQAAICGRR